MFSHGNYACTTCSCYCVAGILKKPLSTQEGNLSCDCDSQCSCDLSTCSSLSGDLVEQPLVTPDRPSSPDNSCMHSSVTLPCSGGNSKYVVWQHPETSVLMLHDPNESGEVCTADCHDSNSDSAIDLPKGDRNMTQGVELSTFSGLSLADNVTKQSLHANYSTSLQRLDDKNVVLRDNNSTETSIPIPDQNNLSLERKESRNLYSSPGDTASSAVGVGSPDTNSHATTMNVLPADSESSADDYSTYSIRPRNGPMRMFQSNSAL